MDVKAVSNSYTDLNIKAMSKSKLEKHYNNIIPSSKMWRRRLMFFITFTFLVVIMVFMSTVNQGPSNFQWLLGVGKTFGVKEATSTHNFELPRDKFLGGLLSNSFDEDSCLSRYESAMYWNQSTHQKPSAYLLSRLRKYEKLHRQCGPNTELYNKSISQLKSNSSVGPLDCNYVVWLPSDGLGNAIMTIISAFLYALLNDKVLLLSLPDDLLGLFCEPFPGTSWILPFDFPVENFRDLDKGMPQSYGSMVKNNVLSHDIADNTNVSLPAYVYLHLRHDYTEPDKLFFCEEAQFLLRKFPWLLLRSNNYFVPALFLISDYDDELNQLFPEKETVFHCLSRYLLHPTNIVWGYITRYYDTYLANAKKRIGIQIRTFSIRPMSFEQMLSQVINCTLTEKILPEINSEVPVSRHKQNTHQSIAVLVTNLHSGYYDTLRNMYYEHSASTGELISVYQPSHEEEQHTEKQNHNAKAFTEMYLLSFSDVLVTSAWSTFGYVAQGLGGLRPWILLGSEGQSIACRHAISMEPCFHTPPIYDCEGKYVDKSNLVRHVRHCEDVQQGLKLFD